MVGNVWRQSQDAKEARWGKKENTNTDANTNINTFTNTNAKKGETNTKLSGSFILVDQ